jgi:hypothetical protein
MATEQNSLQQQIMRRAMNDEAFRQELLSNPRYVLVQKLGISVPEGVKIHVHEDSASDLHLVLPVKAGAGGLQELSDTDLEQVTGGQGAGSQDQDEIALAFGNLNHSITYPPQS